MNISILSIATSHVVIGSVRHIVLFVVIHIIHLSHYSLLLMTQFSNFCGLYSERTEFHDSGLCTRDQTQRPSNSVCWKPTIRLLDCGSVLLRETKDALLNLLLL